MKVFSRLFARKPVQLPEILSRSEEGFADLTFAIVGRAKDASGDWHFHGRATHSDIVVGFEVVLGSEWKERSIDLGDGEALPAYNGIVHYRSTGTESDQFVQILGQLYGVEEPQTMKPQVSFAATSLGANPASVETEDLKIKLFFESEEEEKYAEVFTNVEFSSGFLEIREKDEEYRQPLVWAIAGAA